LPVERLHQRLAGRRVVLNDADAGLCGPCREARGVRRSELDAVVTALRIDELRLETRDLHEREPRVRLGIALPTNERESVRRDVGVAVVV
jgi:hypothetical protein